MGKKLLGGVLFLFTMAAQAAPDPLLITPGRGIGPFRAGMTRSELQQLLKPEQLGEGEDGGGAAVSAYFLDADKRVSLRLSPQGKVAAMVLHGERSQWHTADGITLGTPLSALVKRNGKPIRLRGFDAGPHSGELRDWGGGGLAKELAKVKLIFASPARAPGYGRLSAAQKVEIEKPRDFLSSDLEMRTLDPIVETIELTF